MIEGLSSLNSKKHFFQKHPINNNCFLITLFHLKFRIDKFEIRYRDIMNFSKITSNKISFIILVILLCWGIFPSEKTFALSGREIMEKVNARDVGDSSSGEMEMILIDKKGKKRIRKLKTFGG